MCRLKAVDVVDIVAVVIGDASLKVVVRVEPAADDSATTVAQTEIFAMTWICHRYMTHLVLPFT